MRTKAKIHARRHRFPRGSYRGLIRVAFTMVVFDRKDIFVKSDVVDAFSDILRHTTGASDCTVPIYCFLPDHVHVMLQGNTAASDLWFAVTNFKQRTGYWFRTHQSKARWQKGFYDHILRSNEDRRRQVRYIAENPVRAGLVELWSDYPFTGSIGHVLDDLFDSM